MNKTILDYSLKIRVPITVFVAALTFTLTYFLSRPERDGIGYAPPQPIPFSHKLHAGEMAIDCQYCHTGVTESRHALIPATSVCMNCHTVARKNKEAIVRLTEYHGEGKPLEWKRIHRVPDFAYFNHSVHVNKGIECAGCHGEVKDMDVIRQVSSFTMGSCLNCHREVHQRFPDLKGVNTGPEHCFACHR
ncbi:MAG: cytochrome c3 family protein [Ignavibacteria bacterium]|nr:cytochrome c3 family protein [Ignavibacteria bacterium]